MAKYHRRSSKARSFAIGVLSILKEICTFVFSLTIGILELIGIVVS